MCNINGSVNNPDITKIVFRNDLKGKLRGSMGGNEITCILQGAIADPQNKVVAIEKSTNKLVCIDRAKVTGIIAYVLALLGCGEYETDPEAVRLNIKTKMIQICESPIDSKFQYEATNEFNKLVATVQEAKANKIL